VFGYILRRLAINVPVLIVFSFVMYLVLYKAGDPVARFRQIPGIRAEDLQRIIALNHLDDPWYKGYGQWLSGFVRGDWGTSATNQADTAAGVIFRSMPATLELLGGALIVSTLIGAPLGIYSAVRRYTGFDYSATAFAYLGYAMPTFLVGLLLQMFALWMQNHGWAVIPLALGLVMVLAAVFRIARDLETRALAFGGGALAVVSLLLWVAVGTWAVAPFVVAMGLLAAAAVRSTRAPLPSRVVVVVGAALAGISLGLWDHFGGHGNLVFFTATRFSGAGGSIWSLDHLRHLILPVVALSIISVAGWSRYQRSATLDVLNADYLRTARAKGLSERVVIGRHALRNALLPLITVMAIDIGALFAGAVVTESVFAWPGIGTLFVKSALDRNVPIAMGIVMFGALMIVAFNLIADVAYAVADPRIRLA
jgi:peptide/nickel transport system permease protein